MYGRIVAIAIMADSARLTITQGRPLVSYSYTLGQVEGICGGERAIAPGPIAPRVLTVAKPLSLKR